MTSTMTSPALAAALLAALLALASARPDPTAQGGDALTPSRLAHARSLFDEFVSTHRPEGYASDHEERFRFGVFVDNLALVEESNADASKGFTLKLNKFADTTWDEFRADYLMDGQKECSATQAKAGARKGASAPPASFDWRTKGIVSKVKDQGKCGSCWTFSTTGALEAAWAIRFGEKKLFSEQQLIDCAQAFDNHGCSGGLPSHAFEYVRYNNGLDEEAYYPYEAKNGTSCRFVRNGDLAFVSDSSNITALDEVEMKEAVGLRNPVSVAFEVVQDFRFYNNGTYTSGKCGSKPQDVNHAVLAVGYHQDDYWIIKNSWGLDWGMDGYFQMGPVGSNMCGVSTCSSYPIVKKPATLSPAAQAQGRVATA